MNKQEFIQELSALNIKCLILDDYLVNPNEIFVFVLSRKETVSLFREKKIPLEIDDEQQKRSIRIITYSQLGIRQWKYNLEKCGVCVEGTLKRVSPDDTIAIYLYYAFVYVQTKHWLYYNILCELKKRLGFDNESDLVMWLLEYLQERNYSIKVKKIVELPEALVEYMSIPQKIGMKCKLFWLKTLRRIPLEVLSLEGLLHNKLTRKLYLKYLQSTMTIGENWKILNKNNEGSSGCTLVKDVVGQESFFIKGNELSVYQGLKNEIRIQEKIIDMSQDKSWFLPMLSCDSTGRWIKYEFVTWKLLSKYLQEYPLVETELELLGNYLISTIDKLHAMQVSHNDLRCENIMVENAGSGEPIKFKLVDFGCASIEGSLPWNIRKYWGRYFSRTVCGVNRYSENIVDDAASAWLVYLQAGGKSEDKYALLLKERIGRIYSCMEEMHI